MFSSYATFATWYPRIVRQSLSPPPPITTTGGGNPKMSLSRHSTHQPGSELTACGCRKSRFLTASDAKPHTPTPLAPRTAWHRCDRACHRGREGSCRNLLLQRRALLGTRPDRLTAPRCSLPPTAE